jgi:copper/silver efflux system protein
MLNKIIRYFLTNKLFVLILLGIFIGGGLVTAPFAWKIDWLPRNPVAVDAIPDIGENQQIVFTEWKGRSPQDIEDQITYPLTTSLLGIPGVKTIRSSSLFGISSIYIIFEEEIDFYWSRSRILEKLNSLPAGLLPSEVQPALGPDATGLGQVYWYTLEGRDKNGKPTGGWDLHELRTLQDFYVRYALTSSEGVSEVASIGGYVKEYQVDVDPSALEGYNVSLAQVMKAVSKSNLDIGARTVEVNNAEYFIRALGYVKTLSDIEETVVAVNENVPVRIKDVAKVTIGPATRRGLLDKSGAEAVGGVVTARYGANPLQVIENVKQSIEKIAPGLPSKTLADGTVSKVTIVPFYDRSELIHETLGTLEEALTLEILITILVVVIMVVNLRASILISGLLPLAVLMVFIAMKYFGVDANIVALSGIAIAIGTMVDIGIVLSENMLRHLDMSKGEKPLVEVIYEGVAEVSSAILTAVATTIVSFIPVFALQAAEGKLFRPLAFTKTFALVAALIVALLIIPGVAHWIFGMKISSKRVKQVLNVALIGLGIFVAIWILPWAGIALLATGLVNLAKDYIPEPYKKYTEWSNVVLAVLVVTWLLTKAWLPLGPGKSLMTNFLFVVLVVGLLLALFRSLVHFYDPILKWCLDNKKKFLALPSLIIMLGLVIWMGFNNVFGFVARTVDLTGWNIRTTSLWSGMVHTFPGIGNEFMPALDEGAFLLMPTSMPHAGIEENKRVLQQLDMAVTAIPEVKSVVGKAGRTESALDPAPVSMYENIINYKSEYKTDENGKRIRFAVDKEGRYLRDEKGELIPDKNGEYFRQWREHIQSPDDIWDEIVKATNLPGVTSAPKLQPIETRLVMLQTGMRAPMGIKVKGPDLKTIEAFGMQLEKHLKNVPTVKAEAVFADRIVGKPYLNIKLNRNEMARYGISVEDLQNYIQVAIGGMKLTTTVEGRERYAMRVRYPRELRDNPEVIEDILIPTASGEQVPLSSVTELQYVRGPQMIKSEDTFLVGYVLFDKKEGYAETNVVQDAQRYLNQQIEAGNLEVPAGINYEFTGNYENQIRASKRLSIIVPLALITIMLILYLQLGSLSITMMVFTGIMVALSGGFMMLWGYGQDWFMNFSFMGENFRDLFQMQTVNLSVAVWVGFIALFGIATDDGVLMATYLKQVFTEKTPTSIKEIRQEVREAGNKRVRPAMMTTATTVLALLPVLTATGRGADIMIPMAIPSFGGMLIEVITLFVVPVLFASWKEWHFHKNGDQANRQNKAELSEL